MSGQSSGPHGADQLRLFTNFLGDTALRFLGDTASRVIPTWSVSNLLNPTFQPCLSDPNRLVGVVTTNATVYGSAPPAFESGSLKHQVAALHRVPGGEVFSGSSEDGTEQVATTSVSERDGWLHLAATGFHSSQPTISVALSSQEPLTKTVVCKWGKTCASGGRSGRRSPEPMPSARPAGGRLLPDPDGGGTLPRYSLRRGSTCPTRVPGPREGRTAWCDRES